MTEQWYRIGTPADGSVLDEMSSYFHGILLTAKQAFMYRNWAQAFVRKIGKPYLIDPGTYQIGINAEGLVEEGEISKSKKKMIDQFGGRISSVIRENHRALIPDDFFHDDQWNESIIDDFVKAILKLQAEFFQSTFQLTLTEILGITSSNGRQEFPTLKALLPPYFQLPKEINASEIDAVMDAGRYTFVIDFPPAVDTLVRAVFDGIGPRGGPRRAPCASR